jgi:lipoyl(octanoyl) transferase
VARPAQLLSLGETPYREAWELQRRIAVGVTDGSRPDTILLLEHPNVITLGRRTEEASELHIPDGADVEIVETDRGGKSTFHGPGQLVCYPIFDLTRHGQDVKRFVRDLEEALIATLAAVGVRGERIDGLTGVWLTRPPRKIASIGIHVSRWVTTHGYVHRVDHGVRARGRGVHDDRPRARSAGARGRGPAARRRRPRGRLRPRPGSGRRRSRRAARSALRARPLRPV